MYEYRIKTLEESYRIVEAKINNAKKDASFDKEAIISLNEQREKLYNELRNLRKLEYEESQKVDFDDR